MAKLKKYEPAKGVVQFNWKAGQPSSDEIWNDRIILAEIWHASLSSYDPTNVNVRARSAVLKWNGQAWIDLETGRELPKDQRWRRWCSMSSNWFHTVITVGDWE